MGCHDILSWCNNAGISWRTSILQEIQFYLSVFLLETRNKCFLFGMNLRKFGNQLYKRNIQRERRIVSKQFENLIPGSTTKSGQCQFNGVIQCYMIVLIKVGYEFIGWIWIYKFLFQDCYSLHMCLVRSKYNIIEDSARRVRIMLYLPGPNTYL